MKGRQTDERRQTNWGEIRINRGTDRLVVGTNRKIEGSQTDGGERQKVRKTDKQKERQKDGGDRQTCEVGRIYALAVLH